MKRLATFITSMFLAACSTAPVIVPDTTKDNVIMRKLNYEIQNGTTPSTGWGWILWYIPVLFLVVVWAYNQYLKTKCKEEETKESAKTESTETRQ
jgi:choline-glycine betaine transporter